MLKFYSIQVGNYQPEIGREKQINDNKFCYNIFLSISVHISKYDHITSSVYSHLVQKVTNYKV